MNTSEFVGTETDLNIQSNKKTITSVTYIDGKKYFKKQIAAQFNDSLLYRMAFYKEFEVGLSINNKYIVRYSKISEDVAGLYILMEHINGQTIAEKIESEPEYFHNSLHIDKLLNQLLTALQTLHERNIVYMDLKPENVMLTQVSNDVKLIDLGGCLTDGNDYTAQCTKGFEAAEITEGPDKADARTDIYAVGMLLQYIEEKSGAKLSKRLTKIKERCLNEDKAKRFESAHAMMKALKRRGKTICCIVTTIIFLVSAACGWMAFEGTESHRQLTMYLNSDLYQGEIYYKILSEKDATCEVLGRSLNYRDINTGKYNTYIPEQVNIDGKNYTVVKIADQAFKGYTEIASTYIPKSILSIGKFAFMDNVALASAAMPNGMTEIPTKAFYHTGIKEMKLPHSLKVIGNAAFAECKRLKSVTIPEGIETLELDAFACCDSLANVTLPSTLKSIRRGVFWQCRSISEIHIPASVTEIGEYSFYYCDSLRHVYNHAATPQEVISLFKPKDSITVHVPAASVELYRQASYWKDLNIVGDIVGLEP